MCSAAAATTMMTHGHRRRLRYDDNIRSVGRSVAQKTIGGGVGIFRGPARCKVCTAAGACARRPPRAFAGPTAAGGRASRPADRYASKEWLFTQRPPPRDAAAGAIKLLRARDPKGCASRRRASFTAAILITYRYLYSGKLKIFDASRNDCKK